MLTSADTIVIFYAKRVNPLAAGKQLGRQPIKVQHGSPSLGCRVGGLTIPRNFRDDACIGATAVTARSNDPPPAISFVVFQH